MSLEVEMSMLDLFKIKDYLRIQNSTSDDEMINAPDEILKIRDKFSAKFPEKKIMEITPEDLGHRVSNKQDGSLIMMMNEQINVSNPAKDGMLNVAASNGIELCPTPFVNSAKCLDKNSILQQIREKENPLESFVAPIGANTANYRASNITSTPEISETTTIGGMINKVSPVLQFTKSSETNLFGSTKPLSSFDEKPVQHIFLSEEEEKVIRDKYQSKVLELKILNNEPIKSHIKDSDQEAEALNEVNKINSSNFEGKEPSPLPPEIRKVLSRVEADVAELIVDKMKQFLKCTDRKHDVIWFYVDRTKLWEEGGLDTLMVFIMYIVRPYIDHFRQIQKQYTKSHNTETQKSNHRKLISLCQDLGRNGFTSRVARIIKESVYDKDFIDVLDSNNDLFPLKNGKILELKTRIVRDRTCEDYFTGECPINYDPKAKSEEIDSFLRDITCAGEGLHDYMQIILGSCLSGENKLRELYILYGEGSNGKTTLIEMMRIVLNFYFVQANKEVFIKPDWGGNNPNAYVAALRGARMVGFCETEVGDKINEAQIKAFTGADRITGKPLYKNPMEFTAHFKTFISTNHKPGCSTDKALWDRLRMIPFSCRYTHDPNPEIPTEKLIILGFKDKMMNDPVSMSAFLNWLIVGVTRYYSGAKISTPQCVLDTTNDYKYSQDIYAQFISDKMTNIGSNDPKHRTPVKHLNEAFKAWCIDIMEIKPPEVKISAPNFVRLLGPPKNLQYEGVQMKCYGSCSLISRLGTVVAIPVH